MTVPLLILAACAILVGLVFGPITDWFAHHLEHTLGLEAPEGAAHEAGWLTPLVGTLVGLLGLGLSYLMYAQPSPVPGRLAEQLRPLYLASLPQVPRRRAVRADRRRRDPAPGRGSARSSTSTSSTAWCG